MLPERVAQNFLRRGAHVYVNDRHADQRVQLAEVRPLAPCRRQQRLQRVHCARGARTLTRAPGRLFDAGPRVRGPTASRCATDRASNIYDVCDRAWPGQCDAPTLCDARHARITPSGTPDTLAWKLPQLPGGYHVICLSPFTHPGKMALALARWPCQHNPSACSRTGHGRDVEVGGRERAVRQAEARHAAAAVQLNALQPHARAHLAALPANVLLHGRAQPAPHGRVCQGRVGQTLMKMAAPMQRTGVRRCAQPRMPGCLASGPCTAACITVFWPLTACMLCDDPARMRKPLSHARSCNSQRPHRSGGEPSRKAILLPCVSCRRAARQSGRLQLLPSLSGMLCAHSSRRHRQQRAHKALQPVHTRNIC